MNKKPIKNVSLNIAKGRFLKRFEQLLIKLPDFSTNGHFKETVRKFRTCLIYNEAQGEGALPFLSKLTSSKKKNKDSCVLCMLSATVQMFWNMQQGDMNMEDVVDTYLEALEAYAALGKKAYHISGELPHYMLTIVREK